MRSVFRASLASGVAALSIGAAQAQEGVFGAESVSISGEMTFDLTLFPQKPLDARQAEVGTGLSLRPSIRMEWAEGDVAATLTPFFRLDLQDGARNHADLREAKLDYLGGVWEATAGLDYVFWGKTEAAHLVDIVNQTDALEGADGEDKLGQPMIALRRFVDIGPVAGQATAIWMPYFRARPFVGLPSRLRGPLPVDEGAPVWRDGADEWRQSVAARFAASWDALDFGLSAFHGVSRDPAFIPNGLAPTALRPVYSPVTQLGFEAQYTGEATLWKAEAIYRWAQLNRAVQKQDYAAVTGGLEHTLYGVGGANADLGLIAEYAWDSRGDDALTPLQDDLILGVRLGFNDERDTSALVSAAIDRRSGEALLRLEAERRLSDGIVISLEGGALANADAAGLFYSQRKDSYLQASLSLYW